MMTNEQTRQAERALHRAFDAFYETFDAKDREGVSETAALIHARKAGFAAYDAAIAAMDAAAPSPEPSEAEIAAAADVLHEQAFVYGIPAIGLNDNFGDLARSVLIAARNAGQGEGNG